MKRLYLFLTIILAGLLIISCAKDNAHEELILPDTKATSKELREFSYSDKDVVNIEGALHFITHEAFFGTIRDLTSEAKMVIHLYGQLLVN